MQNIPLSLYIHIPWCLRKCPYCDFNSVRAPTPIPQKTYIEKIIADLQQDLTKINHRSIKSIFIGGGTPTLLDAGLIAYLLDQIAKLLKLEHKIEITIEANPGTVNTISLKTLKSAGINRLSLGVQSCQNQKLQILGRMHNVQQALIAFENAVEAGFDNINIDLMYGLPEQTVQDGLLDLDTMLALKPTHISWYQLTIEAGTAFARNPPRLPNENNIDELQCAGEKLLTNHGFSHYEVSAFCKNNQQCQHNLNYWLFGDYLGIGAGAHGKLTSTNGAVTRTSKLSNPLVYLQQAQNFLAETRILTRADLIAEFMLNTLRLYKPIELFLFTERTGLKVNTLEKAIQKAVKQKLLKISKTHLITTPLGKKFLNDLLLIFTE